MVKIDILQDLQEKRIAKWHFANQLALSPRSSITSPWPTSLLSCSGQRWSKEISEEGLTLVRKGGYCYTFPGYKHVTVLYFDWCFLSCQGPKAQSPCRIHKGTLSTWKAWRKRPFLRLTCAHTHMYTQRHAHTQYTFMSSTSLLSRTSLKCSQAFQSPRGTEQLPPFEVLR